MSKLKLIEHDLIEYKYKGRAIIRVLPDVCVNDNIANYLNLDIECSHFADPSKKIQFQMNRKIDDENNVSSLSPISLLRRMEITAQRHLKKLEKKTTMMPIHDKSKSKSKSKAQGGKQVISNNRSRSGEFNNDGVEKRRRNSCNNKNNEDLSAFIEILDGSADIEPSSICASDLEDLYDEYHSCSEMIWSRISRIFLPNSSIFLDVIFNPPTLVKSPLTLSNFGQEIFTGVPIALGAYELMYADGSVIQWKVNGKLKVEGKGDIHCSTCTFTPSDDDIGEKVSVTLIPRRDICFDIKCHGLQADDLCKVEFMFEHSIKKLPLMPILHPLRREWTKHREDSVDINERLIRILTYNILASLYARMESAHLYGHVSAEHLRKEWRLVRLTNALNNKVVG